ncbi:putative lipid A biosynthesis acyltransferase [Flavobacterium enshiense DK69]|nr:putative lipid A biosynthesis acyltransferase [Flavobacterium enshiense DK69]
MALPHLSERERLIIEKKSYHHLVDGFMEMIKTMTISEKEMRKRFIITNMDLYQEYEAKDKSIIALSGHYASYEWLIIMNKYSKFKGYGVYKRIKNRYFDNLVRKIRSKFDATLIDTTETTPTILANHKKGIKSLYGFIADQNPKVWKAHHWTKFMGFDVPVHTGAEMLAKRLNMNVLYIKGEKLGRGRYQATFVPMVENIKEVPDYEITDMFFRMLEEQILNKPEYYLWTHKRWKHTKEA